MHRGQNRLEGSVPPGRERRVSMPEKRVAPQRIDRIMGMKTTGRTTDTEERPWPRTLRKRKKT